MSTSGQAGGRVSDAKLLRVDDVYAAVDRYLAQADRLHLPFITTIEWEQLRPDELTDSQLCAIRLATFVEDHVPGYIKTYAQRFPIDDSVDLGTVAAHRYLHFFISQWASEEDRHAYVLSQYLYKVGVERDALESELVTEGRKHIDFELTDPLQIFSYTLIQEKITQSYYRQLSSHVSEPVLSGILRHMAKDEGRHFVFFSDVVSALLRRRGPEGRSAALEVVENFEMPLSNVLAGRWRLALKAQEAAPEHDHRAALGEVQRLIDRIDLETNIS